MLSVPEVTTHLGVKNPERFVLSKVLATNNFKRFILLKISHTKMCAHLKNRIFRYGVGFNIVTWIVLVSLFYPPYMGRNTF